MSQSIHQFTVKNLMGEEVNLKDYAGKVVMIVNTASKCGLTPQLGQLEELYQNFKDKGFEVLAFPSNQFGGQEPLEGEAIGAFCQKNYGVNFPVFEKTAVKGKAASDLFQFLSNKSLNGVLSSTPKWNFHKYLVNKEGELVDFYYSTTSPIANKVLTKIEGLL
ncbi:MAG: glutathione peroxidase [Chitinophagales bacterium]